MTAPEAPESGNILVVDDESGVREVCERVLSTSGYRVSTAGSGEEALSRLQAQEFDFILTDIRMPGVLNGAKLLEAIKRKSPTTDVVMMTAFPSLETAIPTLKNGACDYLAKPIENSLLLSVVQRCFERRRLSGELNREKILRQELQAAYEELQKVEKVKESFLSRLNHELRTPFTSVFFALDQIEPRVESDMQPLLKTLRSQIMSVWGIVENMLLFTDLRQPGARAYTVPIEPKRLLQETFRKYRMEAEKKAVTVTFTLDKDVETIDGDPQLLATAFKHLFLNAVYFNKKGGSIHIAAKNEGGRLSITFADTGVGIPSDKLPNIFDNFYQAAEYMTREVGGLGLGLAIVRRIIEAHGGTVTVSSRLGKGSVFGILLPRDEWRANHV